MLIVIMVYETLKQVKFIVATKPAAINNDEGFNVAADIPIIYSHSYICIVKFLSFLTIIPAT